MTACGVVEAFVPEWDRWIRCHLLYIHESGHADVYLGRVELRVPVYCLRSL